MTQDSLGLPLDHIRQQILSGNPEDAVAVARQVVDAFDDSPAAYYLLAAALLASGEADGAEAAMDTARNTQSLQMLLAAGADLSRMQTDGAYAMGLGRRFYNADLLGAASLACACATHDPNVAVGTSGGLHVWAQTLFHQGAGRMEQAVRAFTANLRAQPTSAHYSCLLYALFFVEDGRRRHAEEARNWARLFADPFTPIAPTFLVERRGDRRLRVGYLAPSFTTNQTRQFAQWVLNGHDTRRFEVFAYVDDATVETLESHVTVRSIKGLTYDLNAELIRNDRIDILVDVWGHASNNRMQVFARKPAPVQVSWLNYLQTTGMRAMDYVVHSDFMESPGRDDLFVEKLVHAGPMVAGFRPDPHVGPSPAPSLTAGYVTLASFNHPAKISEDTVQAWARILRGAPNARLLLKYSYFVDPVVQDSLRARFLAYGADPAALDFEGFSKGAEYDAAFARVDLMLDPSPCPGGTTTMQAFSYGVPVLTLDDQSDYYARIGVQALMAIGFDDMVASDWDAYVAKAVALANDPPLLAAMRERVRPAFDASVYRDEPAFIARLEALYGEMIETWLAKNAEQAAA